MAGGWDQHPLTRERLPPGRRPALSVVGKRGGDGWNVALLGHGLELLCSPEQARAFAAELTLMADICDQRSW